MADSSHVPGGTKIDHSEALVCHVGVRDIRRFLRLKGAVGIFEHRDDMNK